jgi:hypothetical protein
MYHNNSKIFKADSVAKTMILCIFTLGCYLIYKLYFLSKVINHNTELNISKVFIAVTISFYTFSFVSLIYGLINFDNPLIFKSHLVIHFISSILDITWIIMVRNRINIIIGANKGDKDWLNPYITSLFHVIYMQYKINQSLIKP